MVTGGGSGIGEEICRTLDAAGYRVAVLDRLREGAALTAGLLANDPLVSVTDVTDSAAVDDAIDQVRQLAGGRQNLVQLASRARLAILAKQQCRQLNERGVHRLKLSRNIAPLLPQLEFVEDLVASAIELGFECGLVLGRETGAGDHHTGRIVHERRDRRARHDFIHL